ncbi:MAG: hypothetical protein ACIAQZ_07500 [Sedimentisphaeraceae bacterium JB056]
MRKCFVLIFCLCGIVVTGCQESAKSNAASYNNPQDFDPQSMAVVMIDQGVYLKTVDGKLYDENISIWDAKYSLQENLIIPAGGHTLGVLAEKSFHHLYGKDVIDIDFVAENDRVYRIMKAQKDGKKIIGIYDKKTLAAEANR